MLDSLKHRIVLLCVLAMSITWAGALTLSYKDARQEVRELLDAHLAQAAALLAAQSSDELEEIDTEHAPELHKYARSVSFQIWAAGKTLALHSANAPDEALGGTEEGFSDRRLGDTQWRVFSSWDREHEYLIHVGEKVEVRDHLLREMIEHLLKPVLYALPLLALLLWLAVHLGLRPLKRVTSEIARRDPQQLDVVDAAGTPSEIRPLVVQLNQLFGRIAESLDNTRRFTADAAHELRTPLAAIRAQAQVAAQGNEPELRQRALQQVLRACDLATHLIEQLLTLARLDAAPPPASDTLELRNLCNEVMADIAGAALEKNIEIALEDGTPLSTRAHDGLLRILLRNLLDNAIRYSPQGSEISVRVQGLGNMAQIEVIDAGPGIPAEQRTRVFDRFYRVLGNGQDGSGLGLSIAQRIADIHAGSIALLPREGHAGLCVRLSIPLRD